MNNFFVSVDSLNSVAYNCYSLVAFNFSNSSYLIYYSPEEANKCKMFISKLNFVDENCYYISDIDNNDKEILNNIGYNIVVSFPSSYTKESDINKLFNDFEDKNCISFFDKVPLLNEQKLCRNSFLAHSNIDGIISIKSFYDKCLAIRSFNKKRDNLFLKNSISISDVGKGFVSEAVGVSNNQISDLGNISSIISIPNKNSAVQNDSNTSADINNTILKPFDFQIVGDPFINTPNFVSGNDNHSSDFYSNQSDFNSDPTRQILYTDGIKNKSNDDNFSDLKKNAGFASSGYIIIGSICLVLAAIIVTISIVLVKNL